MTEEQNRRKRSLMTAWRTLNKAHTLLMADRASHRLADEVLSTMLKVQALAEGGAGSRDTSTGRSHSTKKSDSPKTKDIEAAIHAAQLYFGSDNYLQMRDQQRLYNSMQRKIAAVAKRRGMDEYAAHEQITDEAKRRGAIRPILAKHV